MPFLEFIGSAAPVFRDLAVGFAAVIGAILAWRRLRPASAQATAAGEQADLAKRAHVTELLNRAAGQLSDEKIEVRLAAIYILKDIATSFPDLANPIFEVLQAYLREADIDYGDDEPPIEVREITSLVSRRSRESGP